MASIYLTIYMNIVASGRSKIDSKHYKNNAFTIFYWHTLAAKQYITAKIEKRDRKQTTAEW